MRQMMMVVAAAAAVYVTGASAAARDQMHIVSSSTGFPFAAQVGESFANSYRKPAPVIERFGARTGIRLFCAGVGDQHPDIVSVSRAMWDAELEACERNGVRRITEIKVGYDGLVLAGQKGGASLNVTKAQLFAALAKQLPVDGKLVKNPNERWNDVDPGLPDLAIRVIGPNASAEMRELLLSAIMDQGCREYPGVMALAAPERDRVCTSLRNDGVYVEVAKTYDDAVDRVSRSRRVFALVPYSVFDQNAHRLAAQPIDGILPSPVTMAMGNYPVTCAIHIYVKNQHYEQVPGILEFVTEFTSHWTWGPEGYLVDAGLIPMSHQDRIAQRANAIGLNPMWR